MLTRSDPLKGPAVKRGIVTQSFNVSRTLCLSSSVNRAFIACRSAWRAMKIHLQMGGELSRLIVRTWIVSVIINIVNPLSRPKFFWANQSVNKINKAKRHYREMAWQPFQKGYGSVNPKQKGLTSYVQLLF